MTSYVKVGDAGDVAPGGVKCVRAGDLMIELFNEIGMLVAFDDACIHVTGLLSEGLYENSIATCLWNHARFRIADGTVLSDPASRELRRYRLRVEVGAVEVDIGD